MIKGFKTEINLKHKSCPLKVVYHAKPGTVKKEKHGFAKWAQKKLANDDKDTGTLSSWAKKINKSVDDAYKEDSVVFTMTKVVINGKEYPVKGSKIIYN